MESKNIGPNNDPPSVKRLLEPFRRVYGMRARIGGLVTPSYKETIEKSASRKPPTAADLVCMVSEGREDGNAAIQNGNLTTALTTYESALDLLRSGYLLLKVHPMTLEIPEIPDKQLATVMTILHINLRCLLASTYLELGQYAKAYRCAQDLGLIRPHVNRYPDITLPVGPDCARIMFCKALAGKALGQPVQALMDLDLGLRFSPDDEVMKEERKFLCGLVRNKMDSTALDRRVTIFQRSVATRSMARWTDLGALIELKQSA